MSFTWRNEEPKRQSNTEVIFWKVKYPSRTLLMELPNIFATYQELTTNGSNLSSLDSISLNLVNQISRKLSNATTPIKKFWPIFLARSNPYNRNILKEPHPHANRALRENSHHWISLRSSISRSFLRLSRSDSWLPTNKRFARRNRIWSERGKS